MKSSANPAVLFLCTGNSCRSQMAEGWVRAMHADRMDVYSAGIEAQGLNPLAVQVMEEAGIDISQQRSQRFDELADVKLDLVITVCAHADESCPVLSVDCRKMHVPFDDPPALARNATTQEEKIQHYRRVRDEIRAFAKQLPTILSNND